MSFDSKFGNDFLRVPRLPADGKGFVVWKEWLELLIRARSLYGHLDGTVVKPDKPDAKPDTSPVGPEGAGPPTEGPKQLTAEQVGLIEKYTKELNQYLQEQAIVFQQIASTIPDSLYELQNQLHDTHCAKNGNIRTHFNNMQTMQEELTGLGATISEQDFSAIILGSLPKSYDQFISAVTATTSVLKQELNPEELM